MDDVLYAATKSVITGQQNFVSYVEAKISTSVVLYFHFYGWHPCPCIQMNIFFFLQFVCNIGACLQYSCKEAPHHDDVV